MRSFASVFFGGSICFTSGVNLLELFFSEAFSLATAMWFVLVFTKIFGNIGFEDHKLNVGYFESEKIENKTSK
jgi:hypothetical protein